MYDEHGQVIRQGDRRDLEARAVDSQGMSGTSGDRGELVHDPARHTRRALLGALAEAGESKRIVGGRAQGERDRNFQRGRR